LGRRGPNLEIVKTPVREVTGKRKPTGMEAIEKRTGQNSRENKKMGSEKVSEDVVGGTWRGETDLPDDGVIKGGTKERGSEK